ncbi:MAG TPA: TMEM175 family protein [Thermoanaerobaculia bacterium]|nr:TMEM175 family protein [Thermoanaerobaculia bacterium]
MADNRVKFRLRGREVSRVEAFSDVVFGFALTLIVVSLEVPTSYAELMSTMRGLPAFAICFAILTWVWHVHHTFFRRYALTDEVTIALNTALLFIVLFYIYPMKFMFSFVTRQIEGPTNGRSLMIIYGLGFIGIFALFFLLYGHAWRLRDELELNQVEIYDTITSLWLYTSYIAIGLLSCTIAFFAKGRYIAYAGLIYWLIGPVSGFIGYKRGNARLRVERLQTAPAEA